MLEKLLIKKNKSRLQLKNAQIANWILIKVIGVNILKFVFLTPSGVIISNKILIEQVA